jgi:hypothetical protein
MKNLSYLIFLCLKSFDYYHYLHCTSCTAAQANMVLQIFTEPSITYDANAMRRDRINACDKEEKYEALRVEFADRVNHLFSVVMYIAYPRSSARLAETFRV